MAALTCAAAPPASAAPDEPFALTISSVTPSFRRNSLGPEFLVAFVNNGPTPIPLAALANTVFIEVAGVRYSQGAVISHVIPPEIAPGAEGQERILVGMFGAPLTAGTNTITILIGGVRSSPVRFLWTPDREADRDEPPSENPSDQEPRAERGDSTPQSDVDRRPVALHLTQPRYPPAAFRKGISGTVEVEILIDATGHVAKARVVRSIPELDAAALECVKEWRFRPAEKGGAPVATVASAPITFSINKKKEKK